MREAAEWSLHPRAGAHPAGRVRLGFDPPVGLTRRAVSGLVEIRDELASTVTDGRLVLTRDETGETRWWTWAGHRVNATLKATLTGLADENQRVDDRYLRMAKEVNPDSWQRVLSTYRSRLALPEVDDKALSGLKFSAALPGHLAKAALATRLADTEHTLTVLTESVQQIAVSQGL